ncbi:MAG: acyl-CoA/acyl-ACP dehydrogenase [Sphingopyxis sp.]|nr:acyl-CoA/acyl-ACP dehydrogenase [Sphingopyxis sp.]
MNFDYSDDTLAMRDEVRRVLAERFPVGAVRQAADAGQRFDRGFWSLAAGMGWLGVAIPECFGGAALGEEVLCMIAEEMGAALAPVPFSSSILMAAEALLRFGSEAQRECWLPRLASGETIGCLALAGEIAEKGGRLFGVKLPVIDGDIADIALVAVHNALYLVELDQPEVRREAVDALDMVRVSARLTLDGAVAERLENADLALLTDRIAILTAFEQVGGARASLDMAVGYARDRYAFGRAIASFQAIKHKLADVYVALELARSNAYYGVWALENEDDLPVAASAARLAATEAYSLAAKENIQVHGGMGFTWEADCHLHYRRARELAVNLGSTRVWRDRLIDHLDAAHSNGAEAA